MKTFKLASRRERWALTIYGWLLLVFLLGLASMIYVKYIVGFLSAEKTIDAKILIVEGYMPDYGLDDIIKIFDEKNYSLIITSGTTFDQGFYISGVKTAADLIRNSLINMGFDSTKVVAAPIQANIYRDRTYHSALSAYKYIRKNLPEINRINLVSLGPHARRSKYLFDMVFEPDIEVGNIVIPHISISGKNWYKSSRGFKSVLDETTSYFYVKLFFWPDTEKSNEPK
ncbi:MAG: YdcF family protein [Bacteroidales bacterium]|nr:YdcF family protein [Bacteroidales bacterium]